MLQGLILFLVLAADFFIRFSIVRNKKDEKKEAVISEVKTAENELLDDTDDVIVEQTEEEQTEEEKTEEEKGETDNG